MEKNGKVECLECGKYYKRVCRHVNQAHGLTAREYKEIHGLDVKRGLLCEAERENMREHTFNNGTVDNLEKGAKYRFVKGHSHNYIRSKQSLERLRYHGRSILPHNKKTS